MPMILNDSGFSLFLLSLPPKRDSRSLILTAHFQMSIRFGVTLWTAWRQSIHQLIVFCPIADVTSKDIVM